MGDTQRVERDGDVAKFFDEHGLCSWVKTEVRDPYTLVFRVMRTDATSPWTLTVTATDLCTGFSGSFEVDTDADAQPLIDLATRYVAFERTGALVMKAFRRRYA